MEKKITVGPRQASVILGTGIGYVYKLLWSNKLRADKDADGRWQISIQEIEQRRKRVARVWRRK